MLYTRGGDTMAAYSLVNLIRQFCKEFEIIIPSKARSSGTIISLGADKIMMTKQATLGPIDPSLNSPLNPQNPTLPNNPQARIPVSVESIKGFFDLSKEELKINGERNLKDVLLNLSEKVHPLVLGNIYRSRTQIQMVARKRAELLYEWQKQLLHAHIKEVVAKWEKVMGVKLNAWFVQKMKTRWGSCNHRSGNIRLNTEQVKKPKDLVEYVIVHEMAHLIEPTHNEKFVALLNKFYPNWHEARMELNELPLGHVEWK